MKDLKKLKDKINLLISKKISTDKFDKWIVSQIVRDDTIKFYEEIVDEMGTKLELLRVEFLDSIKWRKTNKDKTNYKEITYSKEYLKNILNKIDNKIKEIKQ
jgi:hypothetical protein